MSAPAASSAARSLGTVSRLAAFVASASSKAEAGAARFAGGGAGASAPPPRACAAVMLAWTRGWLGRRCGSPRGLLFGRAVFSLGLGRALARRHEVVFAGAGTTELWGRAFFGGALARPRPRQCHAGCIRPSLPVEGGWGWLIAFSSRDAAP